MEIIFDLESNSKYFHKVSKVHCICYTDISKQEELQTITCCPPSEVRWGVNPGLAQADLLIGHNILGYDLPVLERLFPKWKHTNNTFDTHIASQLMFPDLYLLDVKRKWGSDAYHALEEYKLLGKHSLKAWGYRLGVLKGDFAETTDWQEYSPEMLEYCKQDVVVTESLYEYFMENIELLPMKAFQLEQQFQYCITKQEAPGILVDKEELLRQVAIMRPELAKVEQELQDVFPERVVNQGEFIPKVNSNKIGYRKDCPLTKIEFVPFNPSSDEHVRQRLLELGWTPKRMTDGGKEKDPSKKKPKVAEEDIQDFDHPAVKKLLYYKKLKNCIGKMADDDMSWLNHIDEDGKLRHSVYAFGTGTRRCSHRLNATQLQKSNYFKDTPLEGIIAPRKIVIPTPGYVFVGADGSSLESRCLGNATAKYDGGALARELVEGDQHSKNRDMINTIINIGEGKEGREKAKTAQYATIYGASPNKLALALNIPKEYGVKVQDALFASMPSLKQLKEDLDRQVNQQGFILSVDGAKVPIPKDKIYIDVNYFLQGMGAVIMKTAYVELFKNLKQSGCNATIVGFFHDEYLIESSPEDAEQVKQIAIESIREARYILDLPYELDGDGKVGVNWEEVH